MRHIAGLKAAGGLTLASSMVWLGLAPTAAFAAPAPITGVILTPPPISQLVAGNQVVFTAKATGGPAEYQFFWTGPNGHFRTTYRLTNQLRLTLRPGRYQVQVYALSEAQVRQHQWPLHRASTIFNQQIAGVTVSNVKLTGPSNASLKSGAQNVTFSATASAPAGVSLYYQFIVANQSGRVIHYTPYSANTSATLPLPIGISSVWVNVLPANAVAGKDWAEHVSSTPLEYNISAYGNPAAVVLKPATTTIPADGKATDVVTAQVEDAAGNVVADYDGTIQVTDSLGDGSTYGLINAQGSFVPAGTPATYAVTNGVVTFSIGASDSVGATQTLTTSALNPAPSGVNISFGSLTVTQVQAVATQLAVSANPTGLSVNTSGAQTTVTVTEEDSAGNPVAQSAYVTLTITGPGSFSSVTDDPSDTIDLDGSQQVTVYGMQGQAGTIQVSAQATGLTAGSVTIPAYVNTAPASLKISSQAGKTSNGTPFTLYTVSLLDTNGNPIASGTAASSGITISDNTAQVGGTLQYYAVANGQPSGSLPSSDALSNGTFTFAVENTTISSTNPTITITDPSLGLTGTVTYTYQLGAPYEVMDTNPASQGYVEAGGSYTVTMQLEDANGNALHTANQAVDFYLASNGAGALLPNGISATGTGNPYMADTNSQGVASVTVKLPNGASSGQSFQVDAWVPNGSTKPAAGPTVTVEPSSDYATQMSFSPTVPGTVIAGTTLTHQTISLMNAVGGAVNTADQLEVQSSNPSVLEIAGADNGVADVTASSGTASLPAITGDMAGTATITVTDLSNPGVKPLTESVTVQAGEASQGTFYVNGHPVGASNAVTVTANSPVALTLYNTDAEGNPVPVTTAEANGSSEATFALSDSSSTGAFRTSPTGSDVSTATIPVGSDSVTLYYVNSAAGSYDGMTATLTSSVISAAHSTVSAAMTSVYNGETTPVTDGHGTVTVMLEDASGNPVAGQAGYLTATASANGVTVGSFTATSTAGQYTAPITSTANNSGVSVVVQDGGVTVGTSNPFNS